MRTWKFSSFAVFTLVFWGTSMAFAVSVWGCMALVFRKRSTSPVAETKAAIADASAAVVKAEPPTDASQVRTIKNEEDAGPTDANQETANVSDASRTLPTSAWQPTPRYSSTTNGPRIKREDSYDGNDEAAPRLPARRLLSASRIPLPHPTPAELAGFSGSDEQLAVDDADEDSSEADDFVVEGEVGLRQQDYSSVAGSSSRLWGGETDSGIGTSIDSGSRAGGSVAGEEGKGVRRRRSGGKGDAGLWGGA